MEIDQHGWLSGLNNFERKLSPNHNDRPGQTPISLLVIHSISLPPGLYGGRYVEDFFLNQLDPDQHPYFSSIHDQQVSAHLFIKRDGQIVQFVPFLKRAWHAGRSSYNGSEDCNDFSIGIELEGTDRTPYESAQYERLAEVTKALISIYPEIQLDRLVGHSDIAPERKKDPGPGFDWYYFRGLLV